MDIHRCRFVPLPPSSINALEFSQSHLKRPKFTSPPRLAVGRANGDIEIWNPLKGSWLQETIIHGGKDRSIDGLVWIQNPNEEINGRTMIGKLRLFSIGYTTTITEWNLASGQPLRQASGNHGEIWCLAAQPALTDHNDAIEYSQNLIAGCTDGALVLYSTQDDNLHLQKLLMRPSSKKAKIISITFQNRNIVAAGCTDSAIRIFDVRNGKLLRIMTLGAGQKGGPKDIIVWAVKALRDGTIISGDSTGELKVWDGKTYTLRQRIVAHKLDVLCLATNSDGSAIFSGGMDRRTVLYRPASKFKGRWIEVAHRRFHSHDVKAMASFEGPGMNIIVSGGHDSSPIVVPIGKYGLENHRTLPFIHQDPPIRSASNARLIISWWDREIWIWRIEKLNILTDEESSDESSPGKELVAKVLIKGEANITSADIDIEGNVLVVSTIAEIKAFQLRPRIKERGYQISKLQIPSTLSGGARLLKFSPNGKWLCIIQPENEILLSRLAQSNSLTRFVSSVTKLSRIDRQIDKLVSNGGLGNYPRTITQVTFSSQSRILVVSDLLGYIDSFVLCGKEDYSHEISTPKTLATTDKEIDSETDSENEAEKNPSLVYGQYWARNLQANSIPQLPATPVVLSFRPSHMSTIHDVEQNSAHLNNQNSIESAHIIDEDRLLVATATSEIYEIEVLKGKLSNWSRRNPPSAFPESYRITLETAKGIIWDVSANRERVWLYSVSWLWMFDLGRDFLEATNDKRKPKLKRKRGICGAGGEIKNSEFSLSLDKNSTRSSVDERVNGDKNNFNDVDDEMDIDDDDDDDGENPPWISTKSPLPPTISLDLQTNKEIDASEESQTNHSSKDISQNDIIIASKLPPSTYHTFKYRPIVGLVTLGRTDITKTPEVVLVERPIWDAKLPPRYYGEQEWRNQEVDGSKSLLK
ncbi:U3 small nucleolar RNA-associated protein 4 [Erysiphe neolycopersici]|uniref:U3 small nucleolar RNA-associated protein 4 n=1 Tax=Erysiphe neolycopersici TaxID=212602 RepID=A0A420HMJ4_9PEZI|nr:U3 small nucleolar RNA-associated protein 4 [Erysiphe neolycopersici]